MRVISWKFILFSLLLYQLSEAVVPAAHRERWMKEVRVSLKRNIRGCPSKLTQNTANPEWHRPVDHLHFAVQAVLPSAEAFEQFQRMPLALTKVNQQFPAVAKQNKYDEAFRNVTKRVWTRLPDHPYQNRSNIYDIFHTAAQQPVQLFGEHQQIKRAFYFSRIRNAIVYPSGGVGAACGRFVGVDGCGSRTDYDARCHQKCIKTNATLGSCCEYTVSNVSRVIVSTALWDNNYHHFLVDSLARLAHFIPYLRNHTDIKIHIAAYEHHPGKGNVPPTAAGIASSVKMRNRLFVLLGIDPDRLVSGAVLADEVILPRSMFCSNAAMNPIEIRLLASQLLAGAYRYLNDHRAMVPPKLKGKFARRREYYLQHNDAYPLRIAADFFSPQPSKVIVIMQRSCSQHKLNGRCWTDETTSEITSNLAKHFPQHRVHLMGDSMSDCLACEIFLYSMTDIYISEHGAAMTNVMFMPAGTLLVETIGRLDSRMFPLCGYYSAMAGSMGIHHYIYAYTPGRKQNLRGNFTEMVGEAAWLYNITHSSAAG